MDQMSAADELVVCIDWQPVATLSPNSRKSWHAKSPDQQSARKAAIYAAREARRQHKDWVVPDHPVLDAVIAWGKGKKRKDSDNALASLKHAIDGTCSELGFDDRCFLTSRAFQRRDPDGRGYVIFIIRPATKEERSLAA